MPRSTLGRRRREERRGADLGGGAALGSGVAQPLGFRGRSSAAVGVGRMAEGGGFLGGAAVGAGGAVVGGARIWRENPAALREEEESRGGR
jgi:hypothetical protein